MNRESLVGDAESGDRPRNTSYDLLRTRSRKLINPMNFALVSEPASVSNTTGPAHSDGEHFARRTEPVKRNVTVRVQRHLGVRKRSGKGVREREGSNSGT